MSRTYVHTPYWVAQNRAAEKDPYNNIDHDHQIKPIYGPGTRTEETYIGTVSTIYRYVFMTSGYSYPLYYDRPVEKTRSVWKRGPLVGWTEGSCDYKPFSIDNRWVSRYEGHCSPGWYPYHSSGRSRYYYSSGWGHSYVDEKREYWGGVRTRERGKGRKYTKLYNSGEDLSYEDGFTSKEGTGRDGGWWW